jgi:succinate-acetate transporter protein
MGIFWISLGFIYYIPSGILASYSQTGNISEGIMSKGFNSDLGLWLVGWGLALFVILVCSIRTNITFIILFTILDAGFFIFAAGHFQTAGGNLDAANILTKV